MLNQRQRRQGEARSADGHRHAAPESSREIYAQYLHDKDERCAPPPPRAIARLKQSGGSAHGGEGLEG